MTFSVVVKEKSCGTGLLIELHLSIQYRGTSSYSVDYCIMRLQLLYGV